jgi:hypothetical protein
VLGGSVLVHRVVLLVPLALGGSVLHRVVLRALVCRAGVGFLALGGSILVQVVLLALHRVVLPALGGSVLVYGVVYLALVG